MFIIIGGGRSSWIGMRTSFEQFSDHLGSQLVQPLCRLPKTLLQLWTVPGHPKKSECFKFWLDLAKRCSNLSHSKIFKPRSSCCYRDMLSNMLMFDLSWSLPQYFLVDLPDFRAIAWRSQYSSQSAKLLMTLRFITHCPSNPKLLSSLSCGTARLKMKSRCAVLQ